MSAAQTSGPTPFISKLRLNVSNLPALNRLKFSIRPKDGSVTRPLSATYTKGYLRSRGYVDAEAKEITVPIFGLYDGYSNTVTLTYESGDGSTKKTSNEIITLAFDDPCHYNARAIWQPRSPTKTLSYDYMLVTTNCSGHSPAVLDTRSATALRGNTSSISRQ
ncbi:MAG: hypothetical protein H0T11_04055 [Chthoniobacterales bacterium]|nr:hypothetical protein [Chthoniobacterales bacterium]